jgi:hypothetical protein
LANCAPFALSTAFWSKKTLEMSQPTALRNFINRYVTLTEADWQRNPLAN